jgi:hypothetical protein
LGGKIIAISLMYREIAIAFVERISYICVAKINIKDLQEQWQR